MKRVICLFLALTLLLAGCSAGNRAAMAEKLPKLEGTVAATITSTDDIKKIVQWMLDDLKDDEDKSEETKDEQNSTTTDEALAAYQEQYDKLMDEKKKIESLQKSIDGMEALDEESYDKTVVAAKQYFSELDSTVIDIGAIFEYYFSVLEAIKPIEDFGNTPQDAGADPAAYADQLSNVIGETLENMNKVEYPVFMESSHQQLVEQLTEFQLICDDLSYAVKLSDPLRIASSQNRMDRWDLTFDDSIQALNDDCKLQLEQSQKRLDGRIATLRGELENNISALQKAID